MTDFKDFTFEIYNEDELTWQQHNQIHTALNLAYSNRTQTFLKKSYGYSIPLKRILCFHNEQLVGHVALFASTLILSPNQFLKIGGIGMTLSLMPNHKIGHELRKRTSRLAAELGYPFAVGRVRNTEAVKENLRDLTIDFLDVPLIGNTTESHEWETLAIYTAKGESDLLKNILQEIKKAGHLKIAGEVF